MTRVRIVAVTIVMLFAPLTGGVPAATADVGVPFHGWRIQPSPNPEGAAASNLTAVSCPGDGTCTAVGEFSDGSINHTLALHWDGSEWTIQPTPDPKGVVFALLSSVSCAGPGECMAVGFSISSNYHVRPLAERLSGSTWSIEATAKQSNASWAELTGVSCVAPDDCRAVGGAIGCGVDAQERPLAEHWDGAAWTVERVPNPHAENGSALDAVACTSATACEAVGSYVFADVDEAVLAFGWDGSTWTEQDESDPVGSEVAEQHAISCAGLDACTATGSWTKIATMTLAERWDGGGWSIEQPRNPDGFDLASLSGVSCPETTACTSVGSWSPSPNDSPEYPLAERWNGGGWALQRAPSPPGATSAELSGVACSAPGACVAVGTAQVNGVFVTLVEVRSH
jgi:hypothetical protein